MNYLMKVLGVLMLSLACLCAGVRQSAKYRKNHLALKECVNLVGAFKTGILYTESTLENLVQQCSASGEFQALTFVSTLADEDFSEPFYEIWHRCLIKSRTQTLLGKQATDLLSSFGDKLGKTDRENQVRMCDGYLEAFGQLEKKERENLAGKVRISKTAGAAAAVLIIILFA